jgi:TPR repeat protein
MPVGVAIAAIGLAATGFMASNVTSRQEADWLSRLAESGDAGAQLQLGLAYRSGQDGLAVDARTGLYWLQRAAESGNAYAADQVGIAYAKGEGTAVDPERSQHWLQVAAQNGNPDAKRRLGMISPNALQAVGDMITGKTLLDQEGPALQRRAKEGDPLAEYQLAMRYRDGSYGVSRDPALSQRWLKRAAADGHPVARKMLASPGVAGRD